MEKRDAKEICQFSAGRAWRGGLLVAVWLPVHASRADAGRCAACYGAASIY
jgi:hypothetical protein